MAYLGNTPTTQSFISGTDYFNGTGSQTAFTLTRTVNSVNDIQVVVNNVVQQPNDAYTLSGTTLTMTSAPSAGTNNVYVRYLSTTTQVITPSQNTVSWNTLDSNIQQDLGVMYKNRIINGNMVINQRGFSGAASDTYTLDRWNVYENTSGSMTVAQSSTAPAGFNNSLLVTITGTASSLGTNIGLIRHYVEGYNMADLNWGGANAKTVTLSFWVQSSVTGTFTGVLQNANNDYAYAFTYTISSANTWQKVTVTIVGPSSGTWNITNGRGIELDFSLGSTTGLTANTWQANGVGGNYYYAATGQTNLFATNGATWYITGVQLEIGTQATAFSTAGGSYGAELALCQRYLPAFNTFGTLQAMFPYGAAYSTTKANTTAQFLVTPRTSPTGLTTTGSFSVSDGVTAIAATAVAFGGSGFNNCFVDITVASGLTQYRSVYLYTTTSNSQILFTGCEL